jgi:hypothetical protein
MEQVMVGEEDTRERTGLNSGSEEEKMHFSILCGKINQLDGVNNFDLEGCWTLELMHGSS